MTPNKEFDTMFSPNSFNFKANMVAKSTIKPIFINNESLYNSNYHNLIMVEHNCNISQELINQAVEDYFENNNVSGGVSDYSDLISKPKINGVELSGNKTAKDLNLQPAGNYLSSIPDEYIKQEVLDDYVRRDEIKDIEIELPDWIGDDKPSYTAVEVGADALGTADNQISEHNVSSTAHADIRSLISDVRIPEIPKNISEFNNDAGFINKIPDEYVTESELQNMNYAYKKDIPEVPVLSVNGQTGNVLLKAESVNALPDTTQIPNSTGELVNNSGFITRTVNDLTNYYLKSETYTQDEIKQLIGTIPKFSIQPVDILPVDSIDPFTVYLLKTGENTENLYTEYIYVNNTWERLGSQTIDLTGYALMKDIPTTLSSLANDMGFITNTVIDLVNYYKKNEVYNKEEIDGKGFLTQHQDISGKLDANKLPEAINTALAQAKESGEFDGKDGLNGKDGKNGVDGYTPVKGVDYWTTNDQQEIIQGAANRVKVPTKISELQNDAGYLTDHQDLSLYPKVIIANTNIRSFTTAQLDQYCSHGHIEHWSNVSNRSDYKLGDICLLKAYNTSNNNQKVYIVVFTLYSTSTGVQGLSLGYAPTEWST